MPMEEAFLGVITNCASLSVAYPKGPGCDPVPIDPAEVDGIGSTFSFNTADEAAAILLDVKVNCLPPVYPDGMEEKLELPQSWKIPSPTGSAVG